MHKAEEQTVARDLPELVRPLGWLIGTWRGEGVGGYPTIAGGDFRYGEEITFDCPGKPLLTFTSKSWALDDGRPLALQTGYWRPTSASAFETVLAVAAGLVIIGYGSVIEGPTGVHVEVESHTIATTETAKEVSKDKRMYAVRGGQLMYAMDMAAMGNSLAPHLSAVLARAD